MPGTGLPAPTACMHSILGSLLAAFWRTRPTGEEDEAEAGDSPGAAGVAGAAAVAKSRSVPQVDGCSGALRFGGAGLSGSTSFWRPSSNAAWVSRPKMKTGFSLFGSSLPPRAKTEAAAPAPAAEQVTGSGPPSLSQKQMADLLSTDF